MTTPTPPPPSPPCDWPVDTSAVPAWGDAEDTQQALAKAIASYVMWALSGRRFGVCELVHRPCPPRRTDRGVVAAPVPGRGDFRVLWPGWPGSPGWCSHSGGCGCARGHEYALPGPVVGVSEVLVDGGVLDTALWRVQGDYLIRKDKHWPFTQDLALDPGQPGTWQVTYTRGIPVPAAGQYATGILAGEVLKAIRRNAGCRLPSRAQSVSRQGVDVQLLDATTFLEGGRTGLPEVDLWLIAVNPKKHTAPPAVWSPDMEQAW